MTDVGKILSWTLIAECPIPDRLIAYALLKG
jgi:hypothetical protein